MPVRANREVVQAAPLIVICGSTAVGKTAVAVQLAVEIGAEIISADSGQIYRGLDLGTAKPSREERTRVPFHLIDILDPDRQFSAADFRARALEAIRDIQSRGKRVIIAGGTGLYLKALEQGLFKGPGRDDTIRKELEELVKREGVESLHAELQRVDPVAAAAIPPKNRQRLIRAIEVYRLTGRPISEFWREHQKGITPPYDPPSYSKRGDGGCYQKFGLTLPRDELHRRIEGRVDRMVEGGLVEEVKGLLERWGRTAPGLRIIGYKEVVSHLEGRMSLQEAVALIKKNTRRYAKRQMTWFRKDKDIQWVSGGGDLDKPGEVAKVRTFF